MYDGGTVRQAVLTKMLKAMIYVRKLFTTNFPHRAALYDGGTVRQAVLTKMPGAMIYVRNRSHATSMCRCSLGPPSVAGRSYCINAFSRTAKAHSNTVIQGCTVGEVLLAELKSITFSGFCHFVMDLSDLVGLESITFSGLCHM